MKFKAVKNQGDNSSDSSEDELSDRSEDEEGKFEVVENKEGKALAAL